MKLMLFTPTSVSPIGYQSLKMTQSLLKQGHELTIVCTEKKPLPSSHTIHFGVPVLSWKSKYRLTPLLKQAEGMIYQIGEEDHLYAGAQYWALRYPGLISLQSESHLIHPHILALAYAVIAPNPLASEHLFAACSGLIRIDTEDNVEAIVAKVLQEMFQVMPMMFAISYFAHTLKPWLPSNPHGIEDTLLSSLDIFA